MTIQNNFWNNEDFVNICWIDDYSNEIGEYELITGEDDSKNEFVYNVLAMVGGEQKMQKYDKIWSDKSK